VLAEPITSLTHVIAERVRGLRTAAEMTLADLASASGVSRSMLSSIERSEANPSAVVLDRIAAAFGLPLSEMLTQPTPGTSPLSKRAAQPVWHDAQSGYVRRTLTPALTAPPIKLVEIVFPAGGRVAFEATRSALLTHQQIWMLSGRMEISAGPETYTLSTGDCLAMTLDKPTRFFNPGDKPARYLVAHT
jgi:transcriptional regulator with XRE-family HTH domain